jgi:hypothetical protein
LAWTDPARGSRLSLMSFVSAVTVTPGVYA